MVLRILVLLFFLFYSVPIGSPSKINYVFKWREDPCPFIWDRPAHTSLVPPTVIEFENTRYTGGRHHVIPFEILRNFFRSAMLQRREASQIGQYLSAYISKITAQIISNGETIQRVNPIPVDTEAVILIDPVQEMFAALSWLPGNIFIGPLQNIRHHDDPRNQRGGDPGNVFEEYANRIIRDDEHFTALQNLNRDMQLYTRNTLDVDLFHRIMTNLDIVNRRTRPFPFDAQDWEIVNGEFYIRGSSPRKKRSQSQIRPPPLAPNLEPSSDDDPFDYYVGFCRAVKRRLTDSNLSVNKKYIGVDDNMEFGCPKNTFIIVKQATLQTMPWPVATLTLGLACFTGHCTKRDGTENIKKVCDNKRSCVFSPSETDGLDVEIDYYCSHDILTPLQERQEVHKTWRWGSNEFELNCPLNYTIRVGKAMRHSAQFIACILDECEEKDITPIFRKKCDGENPCKNHLENWGLQPITVDFSCIPNPSMFV